MFFIENSKYYNTWLQNFLDHSQTSTSVADFLSENQFFDFSNGVKFYKETTTSSPIITLFLYFSSPVILNKNFELVLKITISKC